MGTPCNILHHAFFVLNFLNLDTYGKSAADGFWHPETDTNYATVMFQDPHTSMWNGPDPVLIWGRGCTCNVDTKEGVA